MDKMKTKPEDYDYVMGCVVSILEFGGEVLSDEDGLKIGLLVMEYMVGLKYMEERKVN